MATKDVLLKKKLITQGVISLVVLIALCAGAMLLSNYDDDTVAEKRLRQNESDAMHAEHDAIKTELGTGFEVSAFYDAYIKNHNEDLVLRREVATQLMSMLHDKNHLTNLSIRISPITDTTMDAAPLKSGILTKSQVQLSFGAVTDNSIYNFIESLERKLPGFIIFQDIKLSRSDADLSRNVLMELSQHRITPLVTGDISFVWLGIRPPDEDKTATLSNGAGNGAR